MAEYIQDFFTASEAGGVGAFVLFLFAIGRKKMNLNILAASMVKTARVQG